MKIDTGRYRGSSPRMRGALIFKVAVLAFLGIIPADAGSTVVEWGPVRDTEDHPRGCGEHDINIDHGVAPLGSSPRMRGARPLGGTL